MDRKKICFLWISSNHVYQEHIGIAPQGQKIYRYYDFIHWRRWLILFKGIEHRCAHIMTLSPQACRVNIKITRETIFILDIWKQRGICFPHMGERTCESSMAVQEAFVSVCTHGSIRTEQGSTEPHQNHTQGPHLWSADKTEPRLTGCRTLLSWIPWAAAHPYWSGFLTALTHMNLR